MERSCASSPSHDATSCLCGGRAIQRLSRATLTRALPAVPYFSVTFSNNLSRGRAMMVLVAIHDQSAGCFVLNCSGHRSREAVLDRKAPSKTMLAFTRTRVCRLRKEIESDIPSKPSGVSVRSLKTPMGRRSAYFSSEPVKRRSPSNMSHSTAFLKPRRLIRFSTTSACLLKAVVCGTKGEC